MNDNAGRVGATALGIMVLVLVFILVLKPGAKQAPAKVPAANQPVRGERRFQGEEDRTLGKIVVTVNSTAVFQCPDCGDHGFAITSSDPANPSNGLNTAAPTGTSAQFTVSPGKYSNVQVVSHGEPWTLRLIPNQG